MNTRDPRGWAGPSGGRAGPAETTTAAAAATVGQPAGMPGIRLRLYRNPLRLAVSGSTWRSAWLLLVYVALFGPLLFAAVLTSTLISAVLCITLAGIPLLIAASAVARGCASAERWRLRGLLTGPVPSRYRQVRQLGLLNQVRTRWRDSATWRDLAYLLGLFAPLWALDAAVLVVWLVLLAGVTLPLWYWAPVSGCVGACANPDLHGVSLGYFPHGPHGPGATGLFVDTLPKALLAAAGFLVLFLLFSYLLVIVARAHTRIALALLSAPADPLAEAKEVLDHPGPLGRLHPDVQDAERLRTEVINGG
jgi:hypothetical protein